MSIKIHIRCIGRFRSKSIQFSLQQEKISSQIPNILNFPASGGIAWTESLYSLGKLQCGELCTHKRHTTDTPLSSMTHKRTHTNTTSSRTRSAQQKSFRQNCSSPQIPYKKMKRLKEAKGAERRLKFTLRQNWESGRCRRGRLHFMHLLPF